MTNPIIIDTTKEYMTPVEIEAALYYFYTGEDKEFMGHKRDGLASPAARAATIRLERIGLITRKAGHDHVYEKTEGLDLYIAALKSVPIPVRDWVMPKGV